jgi:hypothetical protein
LNLSGFAICTVRVQEKKNVLSLLETLWRNESLVHETIWKIDLLHLKRSGKMDHLHLKRSEKMVNNLEKIFSVHQERDPFLRIVPNARNSFPQIILDEDSIFFV